MSLKLCLLLGHVGANLCRLDWGEFQEAPTFRERHVAAQQGQVNTTASCEAEEGPYPEGSACLGCGDGEHREAWQAH